MEVDVKENKINDNGIKNNTYESPDTKNTECPIFIKVPKVTDIPLTYFARSGINWVGRSGEGRIL